MTKSLLKRAILAVWPEISPRNFQPNGQNDPSWASKDHFGLYARNFNFSKKVFKKFLLKFLGPFLRTFKVLQPPSGRPFRAFLFGDSRESPRNWRDFEISDDFLSPASSARERPGAFRRSSRAETSSFNKK